ncbi:MAG: hypothetical protein AAGG69_01110 [Pseudomonadota bacterium]
MLPIHKFARWAACALVGILSVITAANAQNRIAAENLVSRMPEGFHVVHSDTVNRDTIVEMVPVSQSRERWQTQLKVNILRRTSLSAQEFQIQLAAGFARACPVSNRNRVSNGIENGYEFAVDLLMCAELPDSGQASSVLVKTIRGHDALYSLQVSMIGDIGVDETFEWVSYMRGIQVCDTRKPKHPCPDGW